MRRNYVNDCYVCVYTDADSLVRDLLNVYDAHSAQWRAYRSDHDRIRWKLNETTEWSCEQWEYSKLDIIYDFFFLLFIRSRDHIAPSMFRVVCLNLIISTTYGCAMPYCAHILSLTHIRTHHRHWPSECCFICFLLRFRSILDDSVNCAKTLFSSTSFTNDNVYCTGRQRRDNTRIHIEVAICVW